MESKTNQEYIVIRSQDRLRTYDANSVETDTSSNFTLQIQPPLNGQYRVCNLIFPNSIYNLNSNNNTIYVYQSATQYSASITAGVYTVSNLAAAVATALNSMGASGTFSCSISSTTYKMTISNDTTAFQMDFSSARIGCADVLGFKRNISSAAALSQVSDYMVNLTPYLSCFINIAESNYKLRNVNKNLQNRGSLHIPLAVVSTQYSSVDYNDSPIFLDFHNADQITVGVKSTDGQTLSLNNLEWQIMLIKVRDFD